MFSQIGGDLMVPSGWEGVIDKEDLSLALDWVRKRREKCVVFPSDDLILRAFEMCGFDEVKVVVLGQDPYPGRDRDGVPFACGLSFSSESECSVPASLRNVLREIHTTCGSLSDSPDLSRWAVQGVLLMNVCLTVDEGSPKSHSMKVWERITYGVVRSLSERDLPTVFMLWGDDAQALSGSIRLGENVLVLRARHPSPLSANRGFFGCDHFRLCNEFLVRKGVSPIIW
jgi:uracil-DNA glycosylase